MVAMDEQNNMSILEIYICEEKNVHASNTV
jgi:hypothetical protein